MPLDPNTLERGQWRVCPAPTKDARGQPIPTHAPVRLLRQLAPGQWECEVHFGAGPPTMVVLPAEQLHKWTSA